MRTLFRCLLIASAALALSAPGSAGAPDPIAGTWVLNLAKSTFKPGPGPKSQTRVFTVLPDGTQLKVTGLRADGSKVDAGGTFRLDGRDYPYTGNPDFDAIAMTRQDARKLAGTTKLKGQRMSRLTYTVSEDGRTLTMYVKGMDAKEQPMENTLVFDRK